ncbi:hypothetical protein LOD99_13300 [Oopsacas minuta]|uniref:Uncharacterized protein n=1 Tax=Oopsacas minuta TaxID=111878 RepID=A0AAV7KJI5_9METZ|nr:hypothetical protein LOD99_13300 [Oopsacas minuta]
MAENTRSKVFHPIFGYPGPIPENQLPTKLDLYNHYRMLRNEDSKSTRDDIAKELTEVLVRIYNLASIPTISELKIKQYINSDIIERAKYYGKSIQNKQQPDRIQPIISEFNVLFDVSSCKCLIQEDKTRRSRFSVRKELANEAHETINDISAIYFDGRKDQTRVLVEREDGHLHQDTANEEHYTVLSEPGNQYVAHVTPSSGKAKDIARELTDLCRERN